MEVTSNRLISAKTLLPFIISAVIWLGISVALCLFLSDTAETAHRALKWMAILATISLLDLFAIAKVLAAAFALQQSQDLKKRTFLVIRASYWGAIKIACILIFGTILVKVGRTAAAVSSTGLSVGLTTGVSTLVVVPILGGTLWYCLRRKSDLSDSPEA